MIENASKYTDKGGEIKVISEKHESRYIVHVEDNGIGLSEKDQKRIFDEFYRVELGGEARTQGTGLGLSIAKRLAEQMNGDIWVKSGGPGKGSTFSFSLPLVE